jgi:hypothetical protein
MMRAMIDASIVIIALPALISRTFFPGLIAGPFHQGLIIVFTAAAAMALIGALISSLRGSQFYYGEQPATGHLDAHLVTSGPGARPTAACMLSKAAILPAGAVIALALESTCPAVTHADRRCGP